MTHGSRETVPLTKNNTALSVLKVTSLLVSLCVLVVVSARTEPGLETAGSWEIPSAPVGWVDLQQQIIS